VIDPGALSLSFFGVALMAVAYINREKPAWQKDMRAIAILAVGQVMLGTAISVLDLLGR
jgi:hypothetical protein